MATKDITDLQVCQSSFEARTTGYTTNTLSFLIKKTNQHWKVCVRALERALKRGFVDYGTSISQAFLTQEGDELLKEWAMEETQNV